MSPASPLLRVRDLTVEYPARNRKIEPVRAVDSVSFDITPGETVGLVGESGSGKSTLAKTLVRLARATSGSIQFNGTEVTNLGPKVFTPFRKRIQLIFQDPTLSLNPRAPVEEIIAEGLRIHFPDMDRKDRRERVRKLLLQVGLEPESMARLPSRFSGGQRQRICIARALAVEPELLICDEPVSALDVSVQARIVNLLHDLQESLGLSMLFIAHDIAVVQHISDRILVMHNGKLVEEGVATDFHRNAQHPYTQKLLSAVPAL